MCADIAILQIDGALVLERDRNAREERVEEEKDQRRQQPEDEADAQSSEDLELEGRLAEDQGCPGHVEEQKVERGGPGRHRRGEEVGDEGEVQKGGHLDIGLQGLEVV